MTLERTCNFVTPSSQNAIKEKTYHLIHTKMSEPKQREETDVSKITICLKQDVKTREEIDFSKITRQTSQFCYIPICLCRCLKQDAFDDVKK